jgi:GntR family transcriptional regulator of arabinose operon
VPKVNNLLYQRIENYVVDLMEKGKVATGSSLPSERELSKMFEASRIPVRQALQKLETRGIIERRHGRGTYIKEVITKNVQTGRLGILYSHCDMGFFGSETFSSILSGIEFKAKQEEKDLLFSSLSRDDHQDLGQVIYKLAEQVDGFIMVDSLQYIYEKVEQTIRKLQKPMVVVHYEGASEDIDYIVSNSRADTRKAVQLLIDNGHKKIACIYHIDPEDNTVRPNHLNRIRAFKEILADNTIEVNDKYIVSLGEVNKMLDSSDRPTALFCTTGITALTLYKRAAKFGLKVPDDLAIVGYGDNKDCENAEPGLTTIQLPLFNMGKAAVDRLMEKQQEQQQGISSHYTKLFPGELVVRGSCGSDPHPSPLPKRERGD